MLRKVRESTGLGFIVVLVGYLIVGALVWLGLNLYIAPDHMTTPSDISSARKDLSQAAGLLMAGLAGAIGVYFTWRNLDQTRETTQNTLRLAQEGQITERFTKAVEQIGDEALEIRLGGIHALERIARDSKEDHWPIMEVLTAYIRERCKKETSKEDDWLLQSSEFYKGHRLPDVQATLTTIGRRNRYYGAGETEILDLRGTDLRSATLLGAHLEGADIKGADLTGADLREANLSGAWLSNTKAEGALFMDTKGEGTPATLERIYLWGADLRGARLQNTNLKEAVFIEADLSEADLRMANLESVNLLEANLTRTDLRDADLSQVAYLTEAQMKMANGDETTTTLPSSVAIPQWWSTIPSYGDLSPRRYSIRMFDEFALSFEIGETGWRLQGDPADYPNFLMLHTGESTLSICNVQAVYDYKQKVRSASDDIVNWLWNHPHLSCSPPEATEQTIGGVSGRQLTAKVISIPTTHTSTQLGGAPRVPLFHEPRAARSRLTQFSLNKENKNQAIGLTVEGASITIILESPEDTFDKFLPQAQQLLDTVEWWKA